MPQRRPLLDVCDPLGCAAVLATVLLLLAETEARAVSPEKPNVVIVFIDDMGYADPSCFGNPKMKTPHIDRLAEQGVRFTQFYVNSPICSASRVALMTGQYPHRWRIHSFLHSRKSNARRRMANYLDPAAPTLARTLKNSGYATAHFGKWHVGGGRDVGDAPLPQAYGYDESLVAFEGLGDRVIWDNHDLREQSRALGNGRIIEAPKHKTTEMYVDRAIDFIERHRDRPFYLEVFPNDVHDPHQPSDTDLEAWRGRASDDTRAHFFAVLAEMDRQIGRLVEAIDGHGLGEKTLIIFTSDNGPTDWGHYYKRGIEPPGYTGPFFGRKWSLYEGGIRVPFIARWTGTITPGTTNDTTVLAAIDLHPTLSALARAPVVGDDDLDGLDLSESLLGAVERRGAPVRWEYGVFGSIQPGKAEHRSPQLAVRDGDYKLLCNPDGSETRLFNLAHDPGESVNLAKREPQRADDLRRGVLAWWEQMKEHYAK